MNISYWQIWHVYKTLIYFFLCASELHCWIETISGPQCCTGWTVPSLINTHFTQCHKRDATYIHQGPVVHLSCNRFSISSCLLTLNYCVDCFRSLLHVLKNVTINYYVFISSYNYIVNSLFNYQCEDRWGLTLGGKYWHVKKVFTHFMFYNFYL